MGKHSKGGCLSVIMAAAMMLGMVMLAVFA